MILCWMMRKSSKCKRINRDNKAKAKLSKNNEKLTNKEMLGLLVIGEELILSIIMCKHSSRVEEC